MNVPKIAYDTFYDVLISHYRENEFHDNECRGIPKKSPIIWETLSKDKNILPVLELFGAYTSDARIFYRIKTYTKNDLCEIRDSLFIAALKYIGITMPDKISGRIIEHSNIASLLFQFFLEKYEPDLIAKYVWFKVYDHETNNLSIENTRLDDLVEELENKTSVILKKIGNFDEDIRNSVNDFYRSLFRTRRQQAWDLLTPSFKELGFENDIENFHVRYKNLLGIKDLHVWDIKVDGKIASCVVYLEDTISVASNRRLYSIDRFTIEDIESFVETLKVLRAVAVKYEIEGFETVEIGKLFDPLLGNYLSQHYDIGCEDVRKIFKRTRTVTTPRVFYMQLADDGNKWRIDNIMERKKTVHSD